MGKYNIVITLKLQGVDDPGVHHNQQSTRKEIVDIKHIVNNLLGKKRHQAFLGVKV